MPKVSIIIPAYNVAPYIGETLDSVFAQTFGDLPPPAPTFNCTHIVIARLWIANSSCAKSKTTATAFRR